jgi:hypothetical protein
MRPINYLRLHLIKIINNDTKKIDSSILDSIQNDEDFELFFKEHGDYFIDDLYDCINDFRYEYDFVVKYGTSECRYYEAKYVVKEVEPGVFLGWNYYYGGGKHSAPDEIEWLSNLEFVDVVKEIRPMPVYMVTTKTPVGVYSEFSQNVSNNPVIVLA